MPEEKALPEDQLDERISLLLEEIAESRMRLEIALVNSRDERQRFEENHARMKRTLETIHQNSDIDFGDFRPHRKPPKGSTLDQLTSREVEVLRLIAQGFSTKQIGEKLNISFKTAVCHRSHILAKLKCHESATLVRIALQSGLVA